MSPYTIVIHTLVAASLLECIFCNVMSCALAESVPAPLHLPGCFGCGSMCVGLMFIYRVLQINTYLDNVDFYLQINMILGYGCTQLIH